MPALAAASRFRDGARLFEMAGTDLAEHTAARRISVAARMIRRSGNRFADKIMRQANK
jgi:hypothetical protein